VVWRFDFRLLWRESLSSARSLGGSAAEVDFGRYAKMGQLIFPLAINY